jgi:hypothetical protein
MIRRSLVLLAGFVLALSACEAPQRLVLPEAGVVSESRGSGSQGRVVQRAAHAEEQVFSAWIDSKGGQIQIGGSGDRIRFPEGAVAEPTLITVRRSGDDLRFTFAPHGLHFPADARPELRVGYESAVDYIESTLRFVYLDTGETILSELPTFIDAAQKRATTSLDHFSIYALASN